MKRLPILVALVPLLSCASIIHGTKQDIGISSSPTGASVTIDNQANGVTPVVASLKRKDNHIIKIEMPGYDPFETTITRKVSGWVWGNIAFGGLIGLAVDAITGGLYNLTPEQVSASLAKGNKKTSIKAIEDQIYLAVVLKPEPNWKKIGSLKSITSLNQQL